MEYGARHSISIGLLYQGDDGAMALISSEDVLLKVPLLTDGVRRKKLSFLLTEQSWELL